MMFAFIAMTWSRPVNRSRCEWAQKFAKYHHHDDDDAKPVERRIRMRNQTRANLTRHQRPHGKCGGWWSRDAPIEHHRVVA